LFRSYPSEIASILQLAGKNRKELEKVLKYYGKNPADSLKLRAAKFLIVNMPGKYSEYYDAPWNDVATVRLRWTSSSNKKKVLDTYQLEQPSIKEDIKHITAKYLINNIDHAFMVWKEMPWGKDIPFDVFCEEILPYRVGNEPLENWREKVLASFDDLYNLFKKDTTITTLEACRKVNDVLPRFRMDKDFPHMTYTQLMASTRGTCDAMATLAIFSMRGLGIPVTFDFTPKWVDIPTTGHSWNSVRDNSGKHISFMGCQSNPGEPHQGTILRKYRAYRRVYGKQQKLTLKKEDIPPLLHNYDYIVDVTSEHGGFDIWFPIPKDYSTEKGPIYLAILQEMEWHPIAWGIVGDFVLDFPSMKSGIYLPMYYNNGVQTPIGNPFKYEYRSCRFFLPSSSERTRSFTSIAPMNYEWLHLMKGGKFEVSNNSDFSNAKTIYTVETTGLGYHTVSVKQPSTFRYIRYISSVGTRCSISELEFYNENNKKLLGSAMGSTGDTQKVFDGDVDTFFESASNPSWVGLDLGESHQVSKIRYLPRTDGNGIYEGHVYELFYWNENEWQSLGRKRADSHILQYQVPEFALIYLKNITKNKMHDRPFFMEYTQQWF
jgi:hypothetical protein